MRDPWQAERLQLALGEAIRSARQRRRLTIPDLARRFGVHGRTVARWEAGAGLRLPHALQLCQFLEIDVRRLA